MINQIVYKFGFYKVLFRSYWIEMPLKSINAKVGMVRNCIITNDIENIQI